MGDPELSSVWTGVERKDNCRTGKINVPTADKRFCDLEGTLALCGASPRVVPLLWNRGPQSRRGVRRRCSPQETARSSTKPV